LDTRRTGGPLSGLNGRALKVTGQGGVPTSGVSAVIMNLASVTPAGAGFVTAWPSGENRPTTSNLNFVSGRNVANLAVVPVGADGKVMLYRGFGGSLNLIADLVGYVAGCCPDGPAEVQPSDRDKRDHRPRLRRSVGSKLVDAPRARSSSPGSGRSGTSAATTPSNRPFSMTGAPMSESVASVWVTGARAAPASSTSLTGIADNLSDNSACSAATSKTK